MLNNPIWVSGDFNPQPFSSKIGFIRWNLFRIAIHWNSVQIIPIRICIPSHAFQLKFKLNFFLCFSPIFRDGSCHHTSVLSSVSASYKGISDLTSRFEFTSRYNDLARDLDANLAEADMESFRTEDIHALLMTANLPHDTIIDDRTHDVSTRSKKHKKHGLVLDCKHVL